MQFEATHDPDVLIVQLLNPNWILKEMILDLPDPKSEVIRVSSTSLSKDVFNLDECRGLFNIKTGEITFTVSLILKHDIFPQLSKLGIAAPVRINILEKGTLDLKTSNLETHASSFHVSGGHMHKLTVHPGDSDESAALDFKNKICTCDANIGARAMIGKIQGGECSEQGGARILICKGTEITLCWKATGNAFNTSVSSPVDPSVQIGNQGTLIPGSHPLVVNPPTTTTDYTFKTEGGAKCDGKYCEASATVTVDIVTAGDTESLLALNTGDCAWEIDVLPTAVDPKIQVVSIRAVPCVGTNVVFSNWAVTKTDINTHKTHGAVTTNFENFPVPYVGHWRFELVAGNIECTRGSIACFEVALECQNK